MALVSDEGDARRLGQGFRLVRACIDAGVEVQVVPGPSAAIAALVVSGLPTDQFVFEGFLPRSQASGCAASRRCGTSRASMFESPLRVQTLLRDVLVAIGDREVAVVQGLTKLHEEVLRGRVSQVLSRLGDPRAQG